jgi:hypothetical protein
MSTETTSDRHGRQTISLVGSIHNVSSSGYIQRQENEISRRAAAYDFRVECVCRAAAQLHPLLCSHRRLVSLDM